MRRILVMLAAATLLVAACGDDSDDAASEDTGSDDTSADVSDDTNGDDGDSGGGDAAALGDSNCDFVLSGAWVDAFGGGVGSDGSTPSYGDFADQFQAIADNAPDEISDEIGLIADRFQELGDLLGDVDLSDPEAFQDPEVQQAFTEAEDIFDEEFEAASDAVETYFEENCRAG